MAETMTLKPSPAEVEGKAILDGLLKMQAGVFTVGEISYLTMVSRMSPDFSMHKAYRERYATETLASLKEILEEVAKRKEA